MYILILIGNLEELAFISGLSVGSVNQDKRSSQIRLYIEYEGSIGFVSRKMKKKILLIFTY
jgi:hypothetical protein